MQSCGSLKTGTTTAMTLKPKHREEEKGRAKEEAEEEGRREERKAERKVGFGVREMKMKSQLEMESNITILKYYLSIWLVIVKKKKKKKQKNKKVERTEREAPRQSWVSHIIYFFSLNFPIEVELRCTERSRIRWILVALVAQPSPTRGFSLSCLPLFITLRVFFCFCFFFPRWYTRRGWKQSVVLAFH